MAIVDSVNLVKVESNPLDKIDMGEYNGKVRSLFDSYVFPANAFAANDEIDMISLPKNARVISAIVASPSLGTTGIFSLGHRANDDDAEDADAFVASADAGGQAVAAVGAGVGILKKYESETQLYLKCTEVTTAASGLEIKVAVQYVLD